MKPTDENGNIYEFAAYTNTGKSGVFKPVKPEPKKIDLSILIESKLDCEFAYSDGDYGCLYGKLTAIADGYFHVGESIDNNYVSCRPRFNHIHASPNGWDKCPIPEGFVISIWGMEREHSSSMEWYKALDWSGIDMFEITGIAKGYEL